MEYATGHVKRNPDTGAIALRTQFPDDPTVEQLAAMAWLVSTANIGARHAKTDEVAGWDDLYVPEEAGS